MRIIVTGATGFIGKNLLKHLKKKKHVILAIYRNKKPKNFLNGKKIIWFKFDISKFKTLPKKIIEFRPQVVCHLAWTGIPLFDVKNSIMNANMSILFLKKLIKLKSCKKILVSGSCFELYPKQNLNLFKKYSNFIWAKKNIRDYLFHESIKHKIKIAWFRIFFVYGPGQRKESLIPTIIKDLKSDSFPEIKSPNNKNDFIYIDDVCEAFITGINKNFKSNIFDIGSGHLTSVYQIFNFLEKKIKNKSDFSKKLKKIALKKKEIDKDLIADIKNTKKIFGWSNKNNIYQGLQKTLNDYNQNPI